ncbi:MAG: bifunctional adenosylcobinamide kinase/adenosylcobinamide-phosphate guanylyltransferase [Deltaproteobacteria bacterium]|jgi:adenosylcobinamide kinase/adenosylcobinamide-phosphate guanylyltransferase|nr:bifunctional adenosylcobinamide kinase/adenosylcobinamide-phosphate guanylyltransferase [Deltaproteobacteria bacterium]
MKQQQPCGSRIIFCTGGCRSGKSAFALDLASKLPGSKLFVATAEASDAEMLDRIGRHRLERGPEWDCLEISVGEAPHLARHLVQAKQDILLLDCLSSWVSACLCAYPGLFEPENSDSAERTSRAGLAREAELAVMGYFRACLSGLRQRGGEIILVSAETGLGLIPPSLAGRVFRDILGLVNQEAARCADKAYLIVSGLPLRLK